MKLINFSDPLPEELRNAYSPEEGGKLVRSALESNESIEGMEELRHGLVLDTDAQILACIESGEWRLIKEEACFFDHSGVKEQVKERRVLDLMRSPPPQLQAEKTLLRIVDSVMREPIGSHDFSTVIGGEKAERRTDALGATHLPKTLEQINSLSITFLVRGRHDAQ